MTRHATTLLKNVTLPDGRVADISLREGIVVHAGAGLACDTVVDCTGYLVLPGAADVHVHMRGGSQSEKEDWNTGSKSALYGGVTLVVDQPNTVPPVTTPEIFAARVSTAASQSACHFAINSALTADTSLPAMWKAGAMAFGETFFGPSSYGEAIDAATLERSCAIVSAVGGLVTLHAETVRQVPEHTLADHDTARPAYGEVEAVRAIQRYNQSRCRLHFCHLSTAAAVDAVSAGSAEVTPHHLFLSRESFDNPADPTGKVNPPLRTEKERAALWSRWDRIDVIASDHAPHTVREKQAPFAVSPAGIPGVETMMPLLVAKVLDRTISAASLARKTSVNPAALLGIPRAGFDPGNRADFALYPKKPVKIRAENLHSRCGWTPYEGMPAVFPALVIMGGSIVCDNGEFIPGEPRWFAGKGYHNLQ